MKNGKSLDGHYKSQLFKQFSSIIYKWNYGFILAIFLFSIFNNVLKLMQSYFTIRIEFDDFFVYN